MFHYLSDCRNYETLCSSLTDHAGRDYIVNGQTVILRLFARLIEFGNELTVMQSSFFFFFIYTPFLARTEYLNILLKIKGTTWAVLKNDGE